MQHVVVVHYDDDLHLIDDLSGQTDYYRRFLRTGKSLKSLGQQTVLFFAGSIPVRQASKSAVSKQIPASLQREQKTE